jgi:plastocyanin
VALAVAGIAAIGAAGCGGGSSGSDNTTTTTATTTAPSTSTTPSTATTPSTSTAPSTSTTGGTTLDLSAEKSALAFDTTTLSAPAGQVTIHFTNPSGIPHDVAIEGNGVDAGPSSTVTDGASTDLTVTLQKGTYTFYCTVDGHEDAGMKGTLTIS